MRLPQYRVLPILVCLGFIAGCITRADIEEIKKNQKDILAKLDKAGKAAPAAKRPERPRGPDPSKVYSFPAEESPSKGPKDALVTVIEVSDFQ